MRKDYNIHTEWADAERERRRKSMQANEERRGKFCTAAWWYCEKCGGTFHGPEFLYCSCLFDWKQKKEDNTLREISEQEIIDLEAKLSEEDVTIADKFIDYLTESDKLNNDEEIIYCDAYDFVERTIYGDLTSIIHDRANSGKDTSAENLEFGNEAIDKCDDITARIMPYIIHRVKQAPWKIKTVW